MDVSFCDIPEAFFLQRKPPLSNKTGQTFFCSYCNRDIEESSKAIKTHMFTRNHITNVTAQGCLVPDNEESYFFIISMQDPHKSYIFCVICPELLPLSFLLSPYYHFHSNYLYSDRWHFKIIQISRNINHVLAI